MPRVIDVKANEVKQNPAPARAIGPGSRLGSIKKERVREPSRYFLYGDNGTGKSTLAASAPNPIFLDCEGGSAHIVTNRYPFRVNADGSVPPGGYVPRSYAEVMSAIDDLINNPHEFKTLVIDTADKLESMIWSFMIERDSGPSAKNRDTALDSIESYGYGKGYQMAVDEWRALCAKLDRLRMARGMDVVLVAHSLVKAFKNPVGPDFDRYQPALHDKASGFLKGWVDVVGFVRHDVDAAKIPGTGKNARAKGFSTGRRMLMLEPTAAYDAKARIGMPAEVEIDIVSPWAPLAAAVEGSFEDQAPKLRAAIDEEVARIGDADTTAKVAAAVAKAGDDPTVLSRFLVSLKGRPSKTDNEQE